MSRIPVSLLNGEAQASSEKKWGKKDNMIYGRKKQEWNSEILVVPVPPHHSK
jgi:hypothetical protein